MANIAYKVVYGQTFMRPRHNCDNITVFEHFYGTTRTLNYIDRFTFFKNITQRQNKHQPKVPGMYSIVKMYVNLFHYFYYKEKYTPISFPRAYYSTVSYTKNIPKWQERWQTILYCSRATDFWMKLCNKVTEYRCCSIEIQVLVEWQILFTFRHVSMFMWTKCDNFNNGLAQLYFHCLGCEFCG